MRILHVTQRYLPAVGGSELLMAGVSSRLAQQGHAVTVATTDALDFELFWDTRARRIPTGAHGPQAAETIDGVRVLRFPVRHLPYPRLAYPAWRRLLWLLTRTAWPPTPWVHRLAHFTPYVPDLAHWLATTDETFDLVMGMTIVFEPLIHAARAYARRVGCPFVVYPLTHMGAGPAPGADPISSFYTMRHQLDLVRSADAVIAMTPTEATFYAERGVPADKITVAGPGIEPDAVAGGDGTRLRKRLDIQGSLIGTLSTLSFDKGSIHLLHAVRALRQQGQPVQLVMGGALTEAFRQAWEGLAPAERAGIHVLGPVDDQTKRDLLDAIDVFAMPSRTDSFGIVYLEAWLCSKPVVGAQAWGMADMIRHGEDGFLVPFGHVDTLAQTLATLLHDPDLRARLGRQGHAKTLAEHTWARKLALTEQVYRRLTSARVQE